MVPIYLTEAKTTITLAESTTTAEAEGFFKKIKRLDIKRPK